MAGWYIRKMKRILGLDFARVLMTFGIVAYHFSCYSSAKLSFFNTNANGVWGGIYNASFFALSGFCLYYKYGSEKINIISYYYRRWKTILFPYILVFCFIYLNNVAVAGRFFYLDIPKWILLLSFLGVDGYVEFFRRTYFASGVWFVGMIIFIYLFFPVINALMKKNKVFSLIVVLFLYEIMRINYNGNVPFDIHPIVCLVSFMVGMYFATIQPTLFDTKFFLIFTLISVVLIVYLIAVGSVYTKQLLLGWSLLIVFSNIGHRITVRKVNDLFRTVSKISYPIILIHLPVLHKVLVGWNYTNSVQAGVVLLFLCITLCVLGMAINVIIKQLFSMKMFVWLDEWIQEIELCGKNYGIN